MLNRTKVLREVSRISDAIFRDRGPQLAALEQAWRVLCEDANFCYRVRDIDTPWAIPSWEGNPGVAISVDGINAYQVIAVDGSQIYPDRHEGASCFLINTGSAILQYEAPESSAQLQSEPDIFSGDLLIYDQCEVSPESVNALRQEYELRVGLELCSEKGPENRLLLFDGTLIFWHLEAKGIQVRDVFLPRYLKILQDISRTSVPFASYISLPQSRELVNLIRARALDSRASEYDVVIDYEGVTDATIARFFLKEGERSRLFCNNAAVSTQYPNAIRSYFFYLHVGSEIGRVELPAWCARDEVQVNKIASIILDQCGKGHGYPIGLAEAHEQAVVKGPDRDFFYTVLAHAGIRRNYTNNVSQKLMRKKRMGV